MQIKLAHQVYSQEWQYQVSEVSSNLVAPNESNSPILCFPTPSNAGVPKRFMLQSVGGEPRAEPPQHGGNWNSHHAWTCLWRSVWAWALDSVDSVPLNPPPFRAQSAPLSYCTVLHSPHHTAALVHLPPSCSASSTALPWLVVLWSSSTMYRGCFSLITGKPFATVVPLAERGARIGLYIIFLIAVNIQLKMSAFSERFPPWSSFALFDFCGGRPESSRSVA